MTERFPLTNKIEYPFAITNNHLHSVVITPLKQGLQKKLSTPRRSFLRDADFGVLNSLQSIYLVPTNLPNTLTDFHEFQNFHFLRKLRIT